MTNQAPPKDAAPKVGVTGEEMDEVLSGPAPFANKLYVTAHGPVARLTFAEQAQGRPPVFRAAATLTLNDLVKLRGLIDQIMQGTVEVDTAKILAEAKQANG